MYTLLPPELIRLIYDFDPTYHLFFNDCIAQLNQLIDIRNLMIKSIGNVYWNGTMPYSVIDYHTENISLHKVWKYTISPKV